MSFWNFFRPADGPQIEESRLQSKVRELLPEAEEETLILVTCIAGLFAHIAFVDLKIDPEEIKHVEMALEEWTDLEPDQVRAIVELTVREMKDLTGVENYKYTEPLNEMLTVNQRYKLLEGLFALAASDGNAEQMESEEIRFISKGLLLEHKHFISARATIINKLGAMKK